MAITKEKKSDIIGSFGRGTSDTGSPEVQIALLTARINDLTEHFKGAYLLTTPAAAGC